MRIRVLSDLHLEFSPLALKQVECDVVLAGDIDLVARRRAARWARNQFPKNEIIWVLGNHEHYNYQGPGGLEGCLAQPARWPPSRTCISSRRTPSRLPAFLGCTLWTD